MTPAWCRVTKGVRFENLVACHLLKQVQWQQDTRAAPASLHYIRTKDEAEVDSCPSSGDTLMHLVECKLSDAKPHRRWRALPSNGRKPRCCNWCANARPRPTWVA